MEPEFPAAVKPAAPADLLQQLDIRVGTIEAVTEVPGSDKLVELRVSFGDHTRQVLVGMKRERTNPREVEGRQALFVVNLAPRKMAGRVSEGMLLDIGYADGLAGPCGAGTACPTRRSCGLASRLMTSGFPSLPRRSPNQAMQRTAPRSDA